MGDQDALLAHSLSAYPINDLCLCNDNIPLLDGEI